MKINCIINENSIGSRTDSNIFSFLTKKIKDKIDIKLVNVNNFKCEKASINIFFGCINNLLLKYAKSNMLIPNQNTFYKEWTGYLDNFDLIIVKTKYMEEIFKTYVSIDKIKYIKWRSTDLYNNYEKDYRECLLNCCDTKFTNYQKIVDNWDIDFPILNIINGFNLKKKQDNIKYINELNQNEFENIFNKCGIHICLNEIDSYSHNINQCCLVKSIPLIINNGPMKEVVNDDISFGIKGSKKKLKNLLGSRYDYNIDDFKNIIRKINGLSETTLEIMGENARIYALKNQSINNCLFRDIMTEYLKNVRGLPIKKEQIIDYNELPKITLITLTHNRNHFFKLAIYNYNSSKYPKDRIEWLIYDTSTKDNKVDGLLPNLEERDKMGISYYYSDIKESIGESRNNAVYKAKNNIIVFMDDDDYYFPENINIRVNELINNNKKIVGCCYLGSFSIRNVVSYINVPNIYSNLGKNISPASLCFYKDILEIEPFDDENINECESLFKKIDFSLFKEISWENVIVSLSHKSNITNRNVPNSKPNGCHYGFSDKLLKFILEMDD